MCVRCTRRLFFSEAELCRPCVNREAAHRAVDYAKKATWTLDEAQRRLEQWRHEG